MRNKISYYIQLLLISLLKVNFIILSFNIIIIINVNIALFFNINININNKLISLAYRYN